MADLLVTNHLSKSYGGAYALRDACISVQAGSIHGLVGKNGAGKSTLVGIIAGTIRPDTGTVAVGGHEVRRGDPAAMQRAGIATLFQHESLVSSLSIADNVCLASFPHHKGFISPSGMRVRAKQAMELVGLDRDPFLPMEQLSLGERRLLEVGRALSANARIILLDEPTSALTRAEADRLFAEIRQAAARGVAFIYVSHFLSEVFQLCDRITVIRDGTLIQTVQPSKSTIEEVAYLMLGGALSATRRSLHYTDIPALEVRGLRIRGRVRQASFDVRQGEVVGVAGLSDSGRPELGRALVGLLRAEGEIRLGRRPVRFTSPADALRHGVAYLPSDRLAEGIIPEASIRENLFLSCYPSLQGTWGFLDEQRATRVSQEILRSLRVVHRDERQPILQLSGGNQQKVIFGRLMAVHPRILILDGPTTGVDVGAKAQIANIIADFANEGAAIILLSDDMEELSQICDRVLVLRQGKIAEELRGTDLTPHRLLVACQAG